MSDDSKPIRGKPTEPPPEATEPESSPAEEQKVGPGHPPKEYTWKKGRPSPNPKGRPRKPPYLLDLKKLMEDALKKTITVGKDEKKRTLTMAALGIEQLVNQYAKGDRYARRDLMEYCRVLGIDLLAGQRRILEEALAPDHQAILDAYVSRLKRDEEQPPSERVIAPPELLDDDVANPKAAALKAKSETIQSQPGKPQGTTASAGAVSPPKQTEPQPSLPPAMPPGAAPSRATAETPTDAARERSSVPNGDRAVSIRPTSPDQTPTSSTESAKPSPAAQGPVEINSIEPTPPQTELVFPPEPKRPPGPWTRKQIREHQEWKLEVLRIQQSSSDSSPAPNSADTSTQDDQ